MPWQGKLFWPVVAAGAVLAIAGLVMRRSHDITMQGYGTVIGWTGIVVVLLARFFLMPRRPGRRKINGE
ncbi:MAG TPA: hypothetical protein VLT16_11580 [Candidatus Limnocylindrales bacterium]|nr:hypothetical protein [Candidatus Limnocylindrales bacterium]